MGGKVKKMIKQILQNKFILLIFIIFGIVLFSCTEQSTEPIKYLNLIISPCQDTISIGDVSEFSLIVQDASDLFGINLEISFDSTKVELTENWFSPGLFWQDASLITSCEQAGDIICVCITLQNDETDQGISGDGILFDFFLKGVSNGESEINIETDYLYLVDEYGNNIDGFNQLGLENAIIYIHPDK